MTKEKYKKLLNYSPRRLKKILVKLENERESYLYATVQFLLLWKKNRKASFQGKSGRGKSYLVIDEAYSYLDSSRDK